YGVDQFLFVYGDKPTSGGRTSELTVRAMIDEARSLAGVGPFRVGAVAGLGPFPAWKRTADFVFLQVSYSLDAALRWRDATDVDVPVYAGVMVLASSAMARRVASGIPDIEIPAALVDRVNADTTAGVDAACKHVLQLRDSGAFDG